MSSFTTQPGFSSRSATGHLTQFPQRDEAQMSDMKSGFSNSEPDENAAPDVHPDVAEPHHPEPGFSNAMAVVAVEGQTVKAEAVTDQPDAAADDTEESVPNAAKKAAKKTAKKG